MTRVGAVAATPTGTTTPIRKGAPRDDGSTPFADALLDLLATIPQPAPKPVVVKAPPPAVTPDDASADAVATPADAAPVALLQAPPPAATAPEAASTDTIPAVVALAAGIAHGDATAAVAEGSVAVDVAKPATDHTADASVVPADHTPSLPDANAVALQIAAALAVMANGAGVGGPAQSAIPTAAAPLPPAAVPRPALSGVDTVATPGDPTTVTLASSPSAAAVSGAPHAQFAAAFLAIEAQWHPPAATTDGNALPGDTSDDAATPSIDAAAGAAPPLPDGLAALVAATVRQVSHASPDTASTPIASRPTHHGTSAGDDANSAGISTTAPAVAAPAGSVAYPAVAAGAPTPLLNGGQLPSAPIDPGPRQMPEPKSAPAPTAHATLELDADKTGASRIRIAVQGSQVRATITASDVSLASLDRQLPELRRSLEERGFSDIRLAVRAQDHPGTAATTASSTADDTQSFARNRSDQQAQGSTQQQDTGDRAGSQRRRRQKEDEPS